MAHMLSARLAAPILIATGAVFAQEPAHPPPFTINEAFPSKSLRSPPASGATFGTLRVRFDETPLKSIASAFGAGQVAHRGDAGASMHWLCYTGQQPRPFRVWLISHGEMGGTDHLVTEIQVVALPSAAATSDCPGLPAKFQRASLVSGLWVGSTASAWRARLGMPSFENGDVLQYGYAGKVTLAPSGRPMSFDRLNELRLLLQGQSVAGILASQVTSN